MNDENREMGKLLWEKQLFETNGNYAAAEKLERLIASIREKKEVKDANKH